MAIAASTAVQAVFERFEREIVRIPPSEDQAAQKVHPVVRAAVKRSLGPLFLEDFLSGSYSRRVQVAPALKDIDVIIVLNDVVGSFANSAYAALQAIRAAALSSDLVRDAEIRCRSVRVYLHGYDFTVDLVAALPDASGEGLMLARHIPEEGLNDWSWGNPRGQKEAAFQKNATCNGVYIPTVRLAKFWKNGACEAFKSYHAESVLFHAFEEALPYDQALARFFDSAYHALAPGARTEDPGAPGTWVDERLEMTDRLAARSAVQAVLPYVRTALDAQDDETALRAWGRVFGPSFPSPDYTREETTSSFRAGTAGITGLGVTPHRGSRAVQPRSWKRT